MLSIGDVAERTGVATSALRFYETKGLIASVRTSGNQRRYDRSVVRRVSVIRAAQQVGLELSEIAAALAELPEGREPTKADWARMSRSWRHRLDAQIRAMEGLRDTLDSCIGCGCLSLRACALYNPDDGAARFGAGPRFWMGQSASDLDESH